MPNEPVITEWYQDLVAELNDHFIQGGVTLPVQLLKLQEEVGEVAEAYIGAHNLNPRKGVTHTEFDVMMELADVAMVALVAIQMAGHDPASLLAMQARKTRRRLDAYYKDNPVAVADSS